MRHPLSLARQVLDESTNALARRRGHREDLCIGQAALAKKTTQVLLDRFTLDHGDGVDVRQDDRHRGVGRTQASQPLVVQPGVRVLLRVDDDDKCVDARCQTISNLRVACLDRIDIRQIHKDGVSGQGLGSLHPTTNTQPAEQFLRLTAARQHGARFVRRGAPNARRHDLSPAQRIDERGLANARAAQHADHAPRWIDLAAFGRHVNKLANTPQGSLVKVTGSQRAHLVELLSCRRHGVRRSPHANTSRAFSTASASSSTRTLSDVRSRPAVTGSRTCDRDSAARRLRASRAC